MEIKKIVDYVNRGYIASDRLREPDIYYFMDMVVDDINDRLQSKFPNFTNWNDFVTGWNLVMQYQYDPDRPHPTIPFEPPRPHNPYNPFDTGAEYPRYSPLFYPHHCVKPTTPVHRGVFYCEDHPDLLNPDFKDPCICEQIMDGVDRIAPHMIPWHCFPPLPFKIRSNSNYDAIPDEYIRTVIALGVAVKFYTRDEEGEQIALEYQRKYEDALFKMVRDYHSRVPWYFQDREGGFIDFSCIREAGPINLHPRGVVMRGNNTKKL